MGKFIIIGTSGVGGAIARKLASNGHQLHLISRNAERLRELARLLGASYSPADVTDPDQMQGAMQSAGNVVDGLAYCVGSINLKPVHRLPLQDVMQDFELNALGALHATQLALAALKASPQQTASILLFSTVAVQQGFASHSSVAMAKGAVEGLTRALAAELAPKIRVNAIAPSLMRTPLALPFTNNEAMASSVSMMHPLQRLGQPDDVAGMGCLLLTDESSWITGQVIGIDGGRSRLRIKA